jgi:hypothetical protein
MFVDASEIKMVNHEAKRIFTEVVGGIHKKPLPQLVVRIH